MYLKLYRTLGEKKNNDDFTKLTECFFIFSVGTIQCLRFQIYYNDCREMY